MNYAVCGRPNSDGRLTAAARNQGKGRRGWRRPVPLLHVSRWSWRGCGREIKRDWRIIDWLSCGDLEMKDNLCANRVVGHVR